MEANSISPELQEEIQGKVTSYRTGLSGLRYAGELAMAYADGIAEYASKLHLLQQEYDKLHSDHHEIEQQANHLREAYDNVGREYQQLKGEKADWLDIAGTASKKYNELWVQHHDLKEKAEKMAKALQRIKDIDDSVTSQAMALTGIIKVTDAALASYNSNTNQKENNG